MKDAINKLKSLDLDKCSDSEISDLIEQIGKILAPIREIHQGSEIYRASVLCTDENVENVNVDRLSYCPPEKNEKYQRASTPNQTMFYGVLSNPDDENSRRINAEKLALKEVYEAFKKSEIKDGTYQVAVSKWDVLKTISLVTLMNPDSNNKSERLNEMVDDFKTFLHYNSDIEEQDGLDFQKFMCDQFNIRVENQLHYRISALFTTRVIETESESESVDGVLWESAIANDKKLNDSLCVAIKPDTVDKAMECTEYSLYEITIKEDKASCDRQLYRIKPTMWQKIKKQLIRLLSKIRGLIIRILNRQKLTV